MVHAVFDFFVCVILYVCKMCHGYVFDCWTLTIRNFAYLNCCKKEEINSGKFYENCNVVCR